MSAAPTEFVLREVAVLGPNGEFDGPLDVHVRDGVVVEVGASLAATGTDFDMSGLWLMPGAFDCHLHFSMSDPNFSANARQPISRWALETAANARTTLEAGITFVRDAAGVDAGIRDAIDAGLIPGPTTQISIVLLSPTGGHSDGYLAGPGLELSPGFIIPEYPNRPPYTADGADGATGVRSVVRQILRAGADWIKISTTGGFFSEHDQPTRPEFSPEEVQMIVSEASRRGKSVMAHAYGGDGLTTAVEAGARSIEHGSFLTEEQAALMAARGCWLVPTLAIAHEVMAWAEQGVLPPASAAKVREHMSGLGECVAIAREAGVRVAMGTDFMTRDQHGRNLSEIHLMAEAGLTPAEALLSATAESADLCGVGDSHGRIQPGFVFDALVLDEDPTNTEIFTRPDAVTGVFQAGRPALPHARLTAGK